ncbi:MAG: hypothetical protein HY011_08775 [Acidobacteria bacterium]|nr:hypothetical protein [Acidobacteriota bacterium]
MRFKFTPTQRAELTADLRAYLQSGAGTEATYEAARRCVETTKAGTRCKGYAVWDAPEQKCASHLHTKRRTQAERGTDPPVKKRRAAPTCTCSAYKFIHRLGKGYCRHPDPPLRIHPTPAGKRKPGKKRRRAWNELRAKLGS